MANVTWVVLHNSDMLRRQEALQQALPLPVVLHYQQGFQA